MDAALNVEQDRAYLIQGILPVLAASILWAVGYLARKMVLAEITPITLSLINALIVTLFMGAIMRLNITHLKRGLTEHFWKFSSLALTGAVGGTLCMFYALDHLDLGVTTLLEKLQPLFTLALAALFLKEALPQKIWLYACTAIIGSYFITQPEPFTMTMSSFNGVGVVAVLGAAFFWAWASIIGKSLVKEGYGALEVTFLRFALGALLTLPLFFYENGVSVQLNFGFTTWTIIIFAAIGSTCIGYILYYKGLQHVSAGTSAFLEMATPLTSVLLGVLILHETFNWTQFTAMPVLIFAVYKISTTRVQKL